MSIFHELPCPVCHTGFPEQKAAVFEKGYTYRRCPNCDLVYVNPQPEEKFILRRIEKLEQQDFEQAKAVFEKPRMVFFQKELKRIKSFEPIGKLLDVGCGGGGFLEIMKNDGYSVAGIEPNPNLAIPLKNQSEFDIFQGTLEEAFDSDTVTSESHDIVTILDVLEHVPKPKDVLSLAGEILKPGGLVVVRVPNVDYFLLKYAILSPFLKNRISYLGPDYHLYYFNEKNLSNLATQLGFKVLDIRYTHSETVTGSPLICFTKFLFRAVIAVASMFNFHLSTCFTLYARKK